VGASPHLKLPKPCKKKIGGVRAAKIRLGDSANITWNEPSSRCGVKSWGGGEWRGKGQKNSLIKAFGGGYATNRRGVGYSLETFEKLAKY